MRVFTFFVDGELFAVDVNQVQKIARKMPITFIPAAPDAVSGIINLKGRIITVFSLFDLLERGKKKQTGRAKSRAADNVEETALAAERPSDVQNIIIFKSFSGADDQMGLVMDKPGVLIDIDDELINIPKLATGKEESYCISGIAEINNTLYRIIDIDSIKEKYKNNGAKTAENI